MRFFVEKINGNSVDVCGEEFRHMVKVMRLNVGDNVTLFCGDGLDYLARIEKINKDNAVLKILTSEPNANEPKKDIDIYLSLLKGEKMELVCQKITELGANGLFLFETDNSDRKQGNIHLDRLQKIAISASKQCGRSSTLKINVLTKKQVFDKLGSYDKVLFLYEKENHFTLKNLLNNIDENEINNIAIIIGPEGGFTPAEVDDFVATGANSVSLGGLIQRAETAAISTTAIVANKFLL